jgi:hypothetical protein
MRTCRQGGAAAEVGRTHRTSCAPLQRAYAHEAPHHRHRHYRHHHRHRHHWLRGPVEARERPVVSLSERRASEQRAASSEQQADNPEVEVERRTGAPSPYLSTSSCRSGTRLGGGGGTAGQDGGARCTRSQCVMSATSHGFSEATCKSSEGRGGKACERAPSEAKSNAVKST